MGQIEVDGDAYDHVRRVLTLTAQSLESAGGKLGAAVPGMAFGPIAVFIPPAFSALGGLMEGTSSIVGERAQRAADGVHAAVTELERVEDAARAELEKLGGDI